MPEQLADEIRLRTPEQRFGGRVGEAHDPAPVDDDDAVGQLLDDRAKSDFGFGARGVARDSLRRGDAHRAVALQALCHRLLACTRNTGYF
jgi:hypothetical protein